MPTSLTQLRRPLVPNYAGSEFAIVVSAKDGCAETVDCADGVRLPVRGHLASVDRLSEGDEVLISRRGDSVLILGRLRRPGEAAQAKITESDGVVRLDAVKSLKLTCGNSTVELTHDGYIRVDGRRIYGFAKGQLLLQGATIELN